MYKQIIIARKDLNMSPGKLAAQVSHASIAFLSTWIRDNAKPVKEIDLVPHYEVSLRNKISNFNKEVIMYKINQFFDKGVYEQWINDSFTKVILEAKNKNKLLKAKTLAEELGLKEDIDFFLIKDNCYTELTPEEVDKNGVGRTLTCIGFKPMDENEIDKISKKFQLYK